MSRSRRGQMFSTDFILSSFVFFLILSVAVLSWNMAYAERNRFSEFQAMNQRAFQFTDMMVRTPGYPRDWTANNVQIIGLARPDHVIQVEKVEELASMNYNETKRVMHLDRYDYFLNITTEDFHTSLGKQPSNADNIVVERRTVLVNTTNLFQRGTLEFVLWN
ncbi:MAG: hypothetical protein SVS85_04455 [Candidatus Nanohaloarchaea archaeon]|nr:hypothetical protein [Candidatus Nanohaloarchaea archaeon]